MVKAMDKQPGRVNRSWLIEAALFMFRRDFLELGDKSDLTKLMKLLPPTRQEKA